MSFALFVLLPAFFAFAGFVEWRKFGVEDRARGTHRFRTSLAIAGALVLSCTAAHSIVARLEWLDGSAVSWLDAAFQAPFLPGRFVMQRLVEPRYRLVCPICVENVLEISLWLDVLTWSLIVHGARRMGVRPIVPSGQQDSGPD